MLLENENTQGRPWAPNKRDFKVSNKYVRSSKSDSKSIMYISTSITNNQRMMISKTKVIPSVM